MRAVEFLKYVANSGTGLAGDSKAERPTKQQLSHNVPAVVRSNQALTPARCSPCDHVGSVDRVYDHINNCGSRWPHSRSKINELRRMLYEQSKLSPATPRQPAECCVTTPEAPS